MTQSLPDKNKSEIEEAAKLKRAIIKGYNDIINNRFVIFSENLMEDLKNHRKKRKSSN